MTRPTQLHYTELNTTLLARFPELFDGYAELKAIWDGDEPGPHVLYGDLLAPHLIALLTRPETEIARLRSFVFLEELAQSDDQRIRDVLGASVLERLLSEPPATRSAARAYMGPHTRALAEAIEQAWGH